MCGILVWADVRKCVEPKHLYDALKLQNHRGPDNQGAFLWGGEGEQLESSQYIRNFGNSFDTSHGQQRGGYRLGLGHNRLSIIDLSEASHQPMFSDDGRYAIIFNGEIYNYVELRHKLSAAGVEFRTKGDTEVLLQSLIRWGVDGVQYLNGMWAFVLFDMVENKLFLSRDRYGKKPLLYYWDDKQFIVASEYKSIFSILKGRKRILNQEYLAKYLAIRRWPVLENGKTFYEEINTIPPGSALEYDIDRHELQLIENNLVESYSHVDETEELQFLRNDLASAVQLRLRSDVPVAVALSGGVDSSLVSGYLSMAGDIQDRVTFYTARNPRIETNDDRDLGYARSIARSLGVQLKEIDIPYTGDTMQLLERMAYHYEIPLMLSGASVGINRLYQAMAGDGIRVILDGLGGDEVFGGYFKEYGLGAMISLLNGWRLQDAYQLAHVLCQNTKFTFPYLGKYLSKWLIYRASGIQISNPFDGELFHERYLKSAFVKEFQQMRMPTDGAKSLRDLFQCQLDDIKSGRLPCYLYMNDQNSMMYSTEVRSPLLDFRLIKYLQLAPEEKFRGRFNKYALRNAMPNSIDARVCWRSDKQGFRWKRHEFYRNNRSNIVQSMQDSPVVKYFFDVDRILRDFDRDPLGNVGALVGVLFSISLSESVHPCTI